MKNCEFFENLEMLGDHQRFSKIWSDWLDRLLFIFSRSRFSNVKELGCLKSPGLDDNLWVKF